jgi:ATP-dependent helicase HrpA
LFFRYRERIPRLVYHSPFLSSALQNSAMTAQAALQAQFNAISDRLLVGDAARLGRTLEGARAGRRFDPDRFSRDVDRALLAAENRARLRPAQIAYPEELPVVQAREELLEAIRDHQVIVLCGETGSGKTTQLPKLCLELGRGSRGLIGHTQPRRLAARSVANRIAQELNCRLGELVGYETRFDRRVSDKSLVKLMTDGILLAELQRDRELLAYDTIIIDEAHERSLNIDFLLGWLKILLPRRPELKLIITSATLDPERLSRHFADAPIFTVEGRTFPVETRYRPPEKNEDLEEGVANAIDELWHTNRGGDVLVFLPGEREIRDLMRALPGRFPRAEILPLYSRLPAQQQDRVFNTGGPQRIVLSTNVAETSVTVPGIRYVVDVGTARMSRYSPRTGVQQLQIEPVSQAAAQQRAGRCGRVGPGICIRLCSEEDFAGRPLFTDPEILRANLAGVILQMKTVGLGEIESFPWVDAPEGRHIAEGYRILQTVGALDERQVLTPLGRELGRLPLDPRIARIAVAARGKPCEQQVWVLAAALSVQDPHEVPPDAQEAARAKHAEWRHPRSDFLSLLQLWQRWQKWGEDASNRQLRRICRDHFVSYLRMEEWEQVYKQLVDMLEDKKKEADKHAAALKDEELLPLIHKCLLAGLIDHIGQKLPEKAEFQGPRGRRFKIFPGSALAKKPPEWVMSATLAQTSQLFARTNAAIEMDWLEEVGAHLIKRVALHPQWNAQRGEVTCTEQLTLLGLSLGKRVRHYGSINPDDARSIFIREALVLGDFPNKPAFLQQNLALIDTVREKEARLRRPDLLADEQQLFAFYEPRIPQDICTISGFKAWLRKTQGAKQAVNLLMQESDVLRPGANADIADLFPDHLDIGRLRLTLSYSHDPGEDADGVSFHIPAAQLYAVPAEIFDWLVPGLRAAKIEGLIRTLPQHLRRFCTPAAEYANALANSLAPKQGELLHAICTRFKEMTGVQLQPSDFAPAKLAAHLKPRLLLVNEAGETIGESDTLAALQDRHSGQARKAINRAAATTDIAAAYTREGVTEWNFGDLPARVPLSDNLFAYPALEAAEDKVNLRLFESPAAADAAHRKGLRALWLARMPERVRDLHKTAKSKLALHLSAYALKSEDIAQALAERVADSMLATVPLVRDAAGFQKLIEQRAVFGLDCLKRLDDIAGWLQAATALRQKISACGNRWPDSVSDMRTQLSSLFAPGFVTGIPDTQWPRIATYLKAMGVRMDRLVQKPARDAELTAQISKLGQRLPAPFHAARWLIEEWRIALFAQDLRAVNAPTAEKIAALLKG